MQLLNGDGEAPGVRAALPSCHGTCRRAMKPQSGPVGQCAVPACVSRRPSIAPMPTATPTVPGLVQRFKFMLREQGGVAGTAGKRKRIELAEAVLPVPLRTPARRTAGFDQAECGSASGTRWDAGARCGCAIQTSAAWTVRNVAATSTAFQSVGRCRVAWCWSTM
ncbi:hypothetical protein DSL92_02970 [Billgrantia gudaonensis]|uniref:Uncharacterized protein n=1 Tax=Billgrantia gudaonensis TaxID=376427 RepID=A0A432JJY4_9GAMM|nr:hypothetical protein DSL92_02970 [Halomonas gudaonensis]